MKKIKQLEKLLENFTKINEDNLKELGNQFEEQKEKLLENNNLLTQLIQETSNINVGLETLSEEGKTGTILIQENIGNLKLELQDSSGQIIQAVYNVGDALSAKIEAQQEQLKNMIQQVLDSNQTRPENQQQTDDVFNKLGFEQVRALVINLLEDPRYPKHRRSFKVIRDSVAAFSDDELRQILIYSGAIRFGDKIEFWGMALKNIQTSDFSQEELTVIKNDIQNNSKVVPQHIMKIILRDPKFPNRQRSLEKIIHYFTGFPQDKVKMILTLIGARGRGGGKFFEWQK